MNRLIIAAVSAILIISSCSNDATEIDIDHRICDVNVSVSLQNLFSSYNFKDTQHDDINISEDFRTFHSESKLYIQVRTLFYNNKGVLTDSIVDYVTNTNALSKSIKLTPGDYTAITTLVFASDKDYKKAYWTLYDRENLSTAHLNFKYRGSMWSIMSYDAKNIKVSEDQTIKLSLSPKPIGALAFFYLQNFCYKNEATYPTKQDNNIRSLCVYGRKVAEGYKLDPQAEEKFIIKDDGGKNYWWCLSDLLEPKNFSSTWKWFQSNLYDYFYILAPTAEITFGYKNEGENYFNGYGEATYTIQSGKMYLAYWDYFKIGNPYFGLADNNHWNTYSTSTRELQFTKW